VRACVRACVNDIYDIIILIYYNIYHINLQWTWKSTRASEAKNSFPLVIYQ